MTAGCDNVIDQLLERSRRLGSDPRNTNYAGGNASAKGTDVDPVTGEAAELLWVKGSGGDLGTLTRRGLAVLRLDRLRALTGSWAMTLRRGIALWCGTAAGWSRPHQLESGTPGAR